MNIRRGDIFYADLRPVVGSEQGGIRPVLIIQNDIGNRHSPTVICAAITSKMNKRKLPVHVELWSYQEYGLKTPSTMLVEQIMTISAEHLDRCIGKVSDSRILGDISRAMAIQFPVLTLA